MEETRVAQGGARAGRGKAPSAAPPNVLVLMVDQQRADTLGCYGGFGAQVCRTAAPRPAGGGGGPLRARLHRRAPLLAGAGLVADGAVADPPRDALQLRQPGPGALPRGPPPGWHAHPGPARCATPGYHTAYFGKWHAGPDEDLAAPGLRRRPPPRPAGRRARPPAPRRLPPDRSGDPALGAGPDRLLRRDHRGRRRVPGDLALPAGAGVAAPARRRPAGAARSCASSPCPGPTGRASSPSATPPSTTGARCPSPATWTTP